MSRATRTAPILAQRPPEVPAIGSATSPISPRRSSRWPRLMGVAVCLVVGTAGVVVLHDAGPATHDSRVGLLIGVLAAISVAATLAYLAILGVLHVLPTGYDPVRHAVSDYGVGRYRSLFTVALYVSSVGVFALAFALIKGVGSPPLATRELWYLLLIPLARVGMSLYPTNLEGQRISRTGLLHYVFAILAFTFTYLAISGMTPALRNLDPDGWVHDALGWTAWIVGPALALVVLTMVGPLRRMFGLFERIFLGSTNLWFALAAVLLLSRI